MFLNDLLKALWFFLPAGLSNSVAVIATKIPLLRDLNYPVDLGLKFNGKRILGSHKTIRGFIVGTMFSMVVIIIQKQLFEKFEIIRHISYFDYDNLDVIFLGFLLGFGALVGDSLKSFFKRRINIAPGEPWFPFDQIDFVIGGLLFSTLYIQLTFMQYLLIFTVYFLIHPLSTIFSFFIKLKDKPI